MPLMLKNAREPANSLTHFVGAVLSAFGTVVLLVHAAQDSAAVAIIAAAVFGLSLVALYSASSLYHYVSCSAAALKRFRKLDHAMIYVLIAGTYTPLLLRFSQRGAALTIGVWAAAATGIVVKMFWLSAPRWLSTVFYLAIGWFILLDPGALLAIPSGGLWLLALGGASYSVGAVIYVFKKPNLSPVFGFHELFHLFVLLGSALHFFLIYFYAL